MADTYAHFRKRQRGGKLRLSACSLALIVAFPPQPAHAQAVPAAQLPTGASVVSGKVGIQQSGATLNVNQSTSKAIVNWKTFDVGSAGKVNFNQPSASAVILNRVLDANPSQIFGKISAPGQVFIVNPNGILFGAGAQVDVGGLVASTLGISNDNFLKGAYAFKRDGGNGSIVNQGSLSGKAYIALISPRVVNDSVVFVKNGTAALAAGDSAVVEINGENFVSVVVDKSTIDTLVANGGLVQADGGTVVLTAKSATNLLESVVRNTGTLQARTIENRAGRIVLMGDMNSGRAEVNGKLDASAPNGGDGGFIETSAAKVKIANSAVVTTRAERGKTGKWLVDPTDYRVDSNGGDQSGAQLSASLENTDVELQSSAGAAGGSGNVSIFDTVTWSANNKLTLTAANHVVVNAPVTASGNAASIEIKPGTANGADAAIGGGSLIFGSGGKISMPNVSSASNTALVIGGTAYTVINTLGAAGSATGQDLQGIAGNVSGHYALGSDIDASSTASWNGGSGFAPIAQGGASFSGTLQGLGNQISGLTINRPSENYVGLFGKTDAAASISNVTLANASIAGANYTGALAGQNAATLDRVGVSGSVTATAAAVHDVGGVAGTNTGAISSSHSSANVTASVAGAANIGGLVGSHLPTASTTTIYDSYSSGSVTANASGVGPIGGLVGKSSGTIDLSYSAADVTGGSSTSAIGGLAGISTGTVTNSYATGAVVAGANSGGNGGVGQGGGGLIGFAQGTVDGSYATGSVTVNGYAGDFGGLIGHALNATITKSFASGGTTITGGARDAAGLVANLVNSTVTNSYSTGPITVTGSAMYVGGLVGSNWSTTSRITYSYSTGAVSATGSNIGGMVGGGSGTSGNSYWNVTTSGKSTSAQGIAATTSMMQDLQTFTNRGWNTSTIWEISSSANNGFPTLARGTVYVRSLPGSSIYGATPAPTYAVYAQASDERELVTMAPTGTAVWTATSSGGATSTLGPTSSADTFALAYASGLASSHARYALAAGDARNWKVRPAPLNLSASRVYDSTVDFDSTSQEVTMALAGMVNGDSAPTISGSATVGSKNAGTYTSLATNALALSNTNYTLEGGTVSAVITPKEIAATGMSATGKVYDQSTLAGLNIQGAQLTAGGASSTDKKYYAADDVQLDTGSAYGVFADKNAGANKAVTVTGLALTGNDAANYTVVDGSNATATISAKAITSTGFSAQGKVYDATTTAALNHSAATLTAGASSGTDKKFYDGDDVTLVTTGASGQFADKNVGTAKAVTISGLTLSGADAANYTISDASNATATITAKAITATGISAQDRVYDATRTAALDHANATLTSGAATATDKKFYDGDDVTLVTASASGQFADKNAGTAKAVTISGLTLSGADAGNYTITDASNATATITAKAITATGIAAQDRVYDATTTATLDHGAATLSSGAASATDNLVYAGDHVTLVTSGASGQFADKHVGAGKSVTISGLTLAGADAGNYVVSDASNATATVTAKAITATGIAAQDRVYDTTTNATLDHTNAALTSGAASATDNKFYAGDDITLQTSGASGQFADKHVGAGKSVTISGLTLAGADAGNYVVSDASNATATITAKAITATGITAQDRVYDATTTATLDHSGATLGTGASHATDNLVYAGDDVSLQTGNASGQFADKHVGLSKSVTITGLSLAGADAGNYVVSDASNATATVSAKAITATGIAAVDRVYDTTTNATLDHTNAALTSGAASATDNKFYAGDDITLQTSGASGQFADKHVGAGKSVTISGLTLAGADAGNYTITDASNATATVTAKAITASGITAQDRVYDATTTATLDHSGATLGTGASHATDNLVYAGDDVSLQTGNAVGQFATKHVGTGKSVTISGLELSGADAGNYVVSDASNATATVTAKAITATGIAAVDRVYDATTNATLDHTAATLTSGAASATDNLVYAGDDVTLQTGNASGQFADKHVGLGKSVTITGLTLAGADAGNYVVSDASNATATVTAKAITASGITAQGRVYDTTTNATLDHTNAVLTSGAASSTDNKYYAGDDITLQTSGASGQFADKHVGVDKSVTISGLTLAGADAGNYTITDASNATATVTAKTITASGITAQDRVYDATRTATLDHSGATIGSGAASATDNLVYAGDDVALQTGNAIGQFATKHVGTGKSVTITGLELSGADAGNYVVSDASNASATVTAKEITATGIAAVGRVYDATTNATLDHTGATLTAGAASATDNLVYDGDHVTLLTSGASGQFADKNIGTDKSVTITGLALGGADAGNYVVSDASNASATVTAKALTASGITASSRTYDATNAATLNTQSAALTGVMGSDSVTLDTSAASGTFANKNAGVGKAVTVSGLVIDGADAGNYTISDSSAGTATIFKKDVTVTGIRAASKTYNATTAARLNTRSAEVSGVIDGDSAELDTSAATGSFANKNVGSNKSVTVSGLAMSGDDGGNYNVVVGSQVKANITPKTVVASGIKAANKIYDESDAATLDISAALKSGAMSENDGKVYSGDSVRVSGTQGNFSDKYPGLNKTVNLSGGTLVGTDAGNYTLTYGPVKASIAYNESNPAPSVRSVPVPSMNTGSVLFSSPGTADANNLGRMDVQLPSTGSPGEFALGLPPAVAKVLAANRDTLFAASVDGTPLPDWLSFDPATLKLTGTPPPQWKDQMIAIRAGTKSVLVHLHAQ